MKFIYNLLSKILYLRQRVGGINPNLNIFSTQYLAIYTHNIFVKKYIMQNSGKCLDFGCGKKPYKRYSKNLEWIGIDIEGNQYADYIIRNNAIPQECNGFNLIFSTNVIEHVQELDINIKELIRVSNPKANFLVTIPFLFNEHSGPYDFRRFTKYGIKDFFERYDFEITEIQTFGGVGSVIIVAFQDWLEIQLSKTKIGLLAKILTIPLFFIYTPLLNLLGLILDKLDTTNCFYTSVGVYARKKA